ncbi:Hypothetical predicted protein [Xyrichtys novacula]|uniref:Uncharacterized protein n=1 Tax=Xyrichtys novacula TaxID=13765 RepID=A0AAV1FB44_XYRNO|nr:Hypothetical predicted protein [Xyrichtys novacula]
MIQGCCYSGTEPHQQQHHPSASSGSTAAKRTAPGSLSYGTAEQQGDPCPLRAKSFLPPPPLSAFESEHHQHQHRRLETRPAGTQRGVSSTFLTGAPRLKAHFYRGDCTVFGICRLLRAWNRTKGMALRRKDSVLCAVAVLSD